MTEILGAIHVHSSFSHDGRDSIAQISAWARAAGLSFVTITDHAEDFDRSTFEQLQAECAKHSDEHLALLAGLEFRFVGHPGFHLLACGLSQWIEPTTPEDFLRLARVHANLLIAAHPVIWRNSYPSSLLKQFDAIEVWNAVYNTRFLPDPGALRLLRSLRREGASTRAIVGLDQHDRTNDRGIRVAISATEVDPLAAIRGGRYSNIGVSMRFGPHAAWSPLRQIALEFARGVFDVVESLQDRIARRKLKK